jgi:hypothetical protein
MRALLFLAGVQLSCACILSAAVLLYNGRPGWWWMALLSLGFLPALRIR